MGRRLNVDPTRCVTSRFFPNALKGNRHTLESSNPWFAINRPYPCLTPGEHDEEEEEGEEEEEEEQQQPKLPAKRGRAGTNTVKTATAKRARGPTTTAAATRGSTREAAKPKPQTKGNVQQQGADATTFAQANGRVQGGGEGGDDGDEGEAPGRLRGAQEGGCSS